MKIFYRFYDAVCFFYFSILKKEENFLQRKRSEKEYQDYLARCCKVCGGLLEPEQGKICECSSFIDKERNCQIQKEEME